VGNGFAAAGGGSVSYIHQQRGLKTGILLNQEYSPERLTEESLTLFPDVVYGVSATLAAAQARTRRAYGSGVRRRRR
jgi:hypothetical protein